MGHNGTQTAPTLESNPIQLDVEAAESIVSELDAHVGSLFTLFHQYQKHHWLVEGPQFRDLHLYLEESYDEVHEDLDEIAERMTVLEGIPSSSLHALASVSYITHEEEGERPVREMLKADLEAEQTIIRRLRETIKLATESSDYGTEHLLKGVLYRAEERAHHLDHYLSRNTLTRG